MYKYSPFLYIVHFMEDFQKKFPYAINESENSAVSVTIKNWWKIESFENADSKSARDRTKDSILVPKAA